jgi:hypothetical protein
VKVYREDLTGQPVNQSLTIYFVGGFFILARFLPGFGGIYDNLLKFKQRLVAVNTSLMKYNLTLQIWTIRPQLTLENKFL